MIQKYADLLKELADGQLYSAGTIVSFAKARGHATPFSQLFRMRLLLDRSARINFPKHGDGRLSFKRQAQIPAWFGWRWKSLPCAGEGEDKS